jgi:glycosyltransferase involved in cell wall biosynthesis
MACGKPVVTDSTYENFVRENNVGIVVSTEDYDGAADAIIRLLKDRTLMNIQGENGRNLAVSAFTWGITAKKILRVCETMV